MEILPSVTRTNPNHGPEMCVFFSRANQTLPGVDFRMFEKSSLGSGFTRNICPYHMKHGTAEVLKTIISQLGLVIPSAGKTSSGRTQGIEVHVFRFSFVPIFFALSSPSQTFEQHKLSIFQTPDTAIVLS